MEFSISADDYGVSLSKYPEGSLRLIFSNDSLLALEWLLDEEAYQALKKAGGREMTSWRINCDGETCHLHHLWIWATVVSDSHVKIKFAGHVGDIHGTCANVEGSYHFPREAWYKIIDLIIDHFEPKTDNT